MANITEIERELLGLPAAERERLALRAWESLVESGEAASDPNIDPEGLELANERDTELERGKVDAVEEKEFRRRTGGMNEG
ncbi:MAG: addiction module protein [Gammaproteobacteria bacterium]|nr:addiction module protein [Gammaproteobacteria bacterium]